MSLGLVGRKVGMTHVYSEAGIRVPVTVLQLPPNRIVQLKSVKLDGYDAVQVTYGDSPSSSRRRKCKPILGHFSKNAVKPGCGLSEFKLGVVKPEYQPGYEYGVDLFETGQLVDVTGTSKGKGYAGAVKRHNFSTQDASHGNSVSHRAPGSIGQNQTPGKVFKGKKMSGHLGFETCTVQNLKVVQVDKDKNLLLVKGATPGFETGRVIVTPAIKDHDRKEK